MAHAASRADRMCLRLRPELGAVRDARHAVVGWARDAGATEQAEYVLALLTTEVVSNAVRHGPSDGHVEVVAERESDEFTVAVRDESPRRPVLRRQPATSGGGRGIHIVDCLADNWGVEATRDGKKVWFSIQHH
jgi:anti-sigma regulatory factor (Ser/Thr protein kinase)